MPGVQKPHWRAPQAANTSAMRARSSADTPSRVTTSVPTERSSEVWQATRARPSTSTAQQPHWPLGEHPSLGDMIPSSSRRAASKCS